MTVSFCSMMLTMGGVEISKRCTDFHGTMYKILGNSLLPMIAVPSSSSLSCAGNWAKPVNANIAIILIASSFIFIPGSSKWLV